MTLDERVGRYVAKCPVAVSGQDGHGTTYYVACQLVHGFALDEAVAMRWMLAWNDGCLPPWKPRELRHKIQEAAKKPHDKPRGHLLGREHTHCADAAQSVARPVPVRLIPKKRQFRTVRTVFFQVPTYTRERENVSSYIKEPGLQSSEPSASRSDAENDQKARESEKGSSEPSETGASRKAPELDGSIVDWPLLVPVPGCSVGRPPEVEMSNADWHALEVSGFVHEPAVQLAAWMFGPGCMVLDESGRSDA